MYPIQCHAGYPMPIASAGKMRITGFQATVETPTSASQVTIVDDKNIKPEKHKFGNLLTAAQSISRNTQLMEVKGLANGSGVLECWLPEPITIRNGISVYAVNIEGGTFKIFRI